MTQPDKVLLFFRTHLLSVQSYISPARMNIYNKVSRRDGIDMPDNAVDVFKEFLTSRLTDIANNQEKAEAEKIAEIRSFVEGELQTLKTELEGRGTKTAVEKFWSYGDITANYNGISLRRPSEEDKNAFFELEHEIFYYKTLLEENFESIWHDHINSSALNFSVIVNGEYAGYCGINDTSKESWEISIELREKFRRKGIGYNSIGIMVDEIHNRLGISEFYARVMYDNTASQKLFEKLGARPDGISILVSAEFAEDYEKNTPTK